MRRCVLLALLLLTLPLPPLALGASGAREISYAEIAYYGTRGVARVESVEVLGTSIAVRAGRGYEGILVGLDPRSGLAPCKVLSRGEELERGVKFGLYSVFINASENEGPFEILLGEAPKRMAFFLFVSDDLQVAEGRSVRAPSSVRGWRVEGLVLHVLCPIDCEATVSSDGPHSLLYAKRIAYDTPLGEAEGIELVYLVLGTEIEVAGGVVSLGYRYLLSYPSDALCASSSAIELEPPPDPGLGGDYYLVLYVPDYARVEEVEPAGLEKCEPPLGIPLPLRCSVYRLGSPERVRVTFELAPLRLRFATPSGRTPGIAVSARDGMGRPLECSSLGDGAFSVDPSIAAPLEVLVEHDGRLVQAYRILAPSGSMDLELPLAEVLLCARDADGEPLEHGLLCLYSLTTAEERLYEIEEGIAHLGYLPEGEYLARVLVDGVEVGRVMLDPTETAMIEVECSVGTVEIAVRDLDRRPISGATVIAKSDSGVEYTAVTDSRGVAVLRQIPLGTYSIEVRYGDEVYAREEAVDLARDETVEISLRTRALIVKVVDALGNPIRGARVSLRSNSSSLEEETDESGKAYFELVPVGAYEAEARIGDKRVRDEVLVAEGSRTLIVLQTDVYAVVGGVALDSPRAALASCTLIALALALAISRRRREIVLSLD